MFVTALVIADSSLWAIVTLYSQSKPSMSVDKILPILVDILCVDVRENGDSTKQNVKNMTATTLAWLQKLFKPFIYYIYT